MGIPPLRHGRSRLPKDSARPAIARQCLLIRGDQFGETPRRPPLSAGKRFSTSQPRALIPVAYSPLWVKCRTRERSHSSERDEGAAHDRTENGEAPRWKHSAGSTPPEAHRRKYVTDARATLGSRNGIRRSGTASSAGSTPDAGKAPAAIATRGDPAPATASDPGPGG